MKTINRISILVTLCASTVAYSQGFVNLDFEDAIIQPIDNTTFLEWNLAVPGWDSVTPFVYYQQEHLSSESIYLLMDSTSPFWAPGTQLAGNYSLAFASGYYGPDPSSGWYTAFITQSGFIPSSARSIRMLASGAPFQVFVGGVEIPMLSLGGYSYGGDISGFSGATAELEIVNTGPIGQSHNYTIVDNIQFSPEAIPEPSPGFLLCLGGLFFAARRLRRSAKNTEAHCEDHRHLCLLCHRAVRS